MLQRSFHDPCLCRAKAGLLQLWLTTLPAIPPRMNRIRGGMHSLLLVPCLTLNPQEAKDMLPYAFEFSERFEIPVIFRPTTRISHGKSDIELGKSLRKKHLPILKSFLTAGSCFQECPPAPYPPPFHPAGYGRRTCRVPMELPRTQARGKAGE